MSDTEVDLRSALQELASGEHLSADRLSSIRRRGARSRRIRTAGAAGGVALAVTVASLAYIAVDTGGDDSRARVAAPTITTSSELVERVQAEVSGAVIVGPDKVTVPAPPEVPDSALVLRDSQFGDVLEVPAHAYAVVGAWPSGAFPGWLRDGAMAVARSSKVDDPAPVVVDQGQSYLACVSLDRAPCTLSSTHYVNSRLVFDAAFGTDEFLRTGTGMEVFVRDDYSLGTASKFVLAGVAGGVERATMVTESGQRLDAEVNSEALIPGASLMWTNSTEPVVRVIAWNKDDQVVADHVIKPCESPVDCEVR